MLDFSEIFEFFCKNIVNGNVWLDFIFCIVTYNVIMYLLYWLKGYKYMPHTHYLLWRAHISFFIFGMFFCANPAIPWLVFHKMIHPTIFMVSAYYGYKWRLFL